MTEIDDFIAEHKKLAVLIEEHAKKGTCITRTELLAAVNNNEPRLELHLTAFQTDEAFVEPLKDVYCSYKAIKAMEEAMGIK
jgi:hypothetical protein